MSATRIPVNLTQSEYDAITRESQITGVAKHNILRTYAREYMRIRNEAIGVAIASEEGEGGAYHAHLLGLEQRVSRSLSRLSGDVGRVERTLAVQLALFDTFLKVYLTHTPKVSEDMGDAADAIGAERYAKFIASTQSSGFSGNRAKLLELVASVLASEEIDDAEIVKS